MTTTPDPTALAAVLTKHAVPDPSMVSKMPKGGTGPKGTCRECGGWHASGAVHLDYMGHADVTRILIEVDPLWSWEPVAWTEQGEPLITTRGTTAQMWGYLTVLGKRVLCIGTCDMGKSDVAKELIGDLLRNGAMRFGIALALWSKAEWDTSDTTPHTPVEAPVAGATKRTRAKDPAPASASDSAPQRDDGPTDQQVRDIAFLLGQLDITETDTKRDKVCAVAGRPVPNVRALTTSEAAMVVGVLRAEVDSRAVDR